MWPRSRSVRSDSGHACCGDPRLRPRRAWEPAGDVRRRNPIRLALRFAGTACGQGRGLSDLILATHAAAILDFVHGVRGSLQVTFEEGTQSAWLYDLLVRHVAKVVVCNPRKNALLKAGNKSDQIDARKLAELLRADLLSPVYHGENSCRILQEFVRSYTKLTEDTTRIMARIKALYRSHAIACAGKKPYGKRHRQEWLQHIQQPGLSSRAQRL